MMTLLNSYSIIGIKVIRINYKLMCFQFWLRIFEFQCKFTYELYSLIYYIKQENTSTCTLFIKRFYNFSSL